MILKFLLVLLTVTTISVLAQDFPPPQNFALEHSYHFPNNWFDLSWDMPDTSTAIGTFDGYLLYRNFTFLDSLDKTESSFFEIDPPAMEGSVTCYYLAAFYHNADGVSESTDTLTSEHALSTNPFTTNTLPNSIELTSYPNPTNSMVVLKFNVNQREQIVLDLLSIDGKYLRRIYSGFSVQGSNTIHYSIAGLNSGTYMVVLKASTFKAVSKLLVVK